MLILLKNKQHSIAAVTLSLFVGSWLFLLCQTCLAAINGTHEYDQTGTEMANSCHEQLSVDAGIDKSEKHCPGTCDCDSITGTMISKSYSVLTEKIKFSPDLYVYTVPQIILSDWAPPAYRIPTTPERAVLLPLQHYTVLLD